jgi:predicted RNA binding protein YcfA (HicA-like mRNA interferase family)
MPKLPALTPQKVIKILEKRGFVLDRAKGSHLLSSSNEGQSDSAFSPQGLASRDIA